MLPLEGITVVALEHAVAAPVATRHLADLGARVIKVERPRVGDFAREYDRSVHGQASYFVWLNRGKESIELDLKEPEDLALLNRMLETADVFIQNFVPGAVERMGLDAATVRAAHPRLVYCSISGYGPAGPYSQRKAYDLLVQCESGLLSVTGFPEESAKVGISIVDIATGMYAHSGILAALLRRERTGDGATIEVSMIDAIGDWMMQPTYLSVYGGKPFIRSGARHASIAPYGPHKVADGVVFLGVQSDREWAIVCDKLLGRPELAYDPAYARNTERVANHAAIAEMIDAQVKDRHVDELIADLDSMGLASARVRTLQDFFEHPQLAARDRWRQIDTPGGPVTALLPPVTFAGDEARMGAVPALGEHSDALRQEFSARASGGT